MKEDIINGKPYKRMPILTGDFRRAHGINTQVCYGCAFFEDTECLLINHGDAPSCSVPEAIVFVEPERAHEHEALLELERMGL